MSTLQQRRLQELIEVLAGQRGNEDARAVTLAELRALQDRFVTSAAAATASSVGALQAQVTDIEAEVAVAQANALAANTAASTVQSNLDTEVSGLQGQIDAIVLDYNGPEGAVAAAEAAQASAELARDQAVTAKTAAATSAADALSSKNASATSATGAAGSATAAANSQTQAQSASVSASGSASSATTSAATAANSANAAGQSATAAATSASTASTKATEAATSAASALTARTGAETARSQAQTSATQASGSATNAATSAGSASTSATAAQNSATSASTASASASTSANTASQAATNAGSSAALASASQVLAAQIVSKSTNILADQFLATESADNWTRYVGQGILSKLPNDLFTIGQTWSFNIAVGNQDGMQTESTDAQWKGPANADAYVLEIDFTLTSGALNGAGLVLDWITAAPTTYRAQAQLSDIVRGPVVVGAPMMASVVLRRPSGFAGTFSFNRLYLMANWSGFGNAAKIIRYHRVSMRVATAEDLGLGQVQTAISAAVSTEAAVRASEDGALAAQITSVNATVGSLSSSVTSQAAALATIDGKLSASYAFRAQAGSSGAVLELIASSNPTGSVSVARISADNILLNGTVSAPLIQAGAITADKLAASSVTATKIAANSITADKIATGAITADKIQAGSITADRLAAKTLTANSGVIADLAVDTLQIAGNAVTLFRKMAVGTVSVTSSYTTIASVTFTPAGEEQVLWVSADFSTQSQENPTNTAISIRYLWRGVVFRTRTGVAGGTGSTARNTLFNEAISFAAGGATAGTFSIQVAKIGDIATVNRLDAILGEFKK